jgi:SepF-like predicted cell division protein (DUF552 family)
MRGWIRVNPQELPEGFDADNKNSHQIRRALTKNGWELAQLSDRTLLIKPDENEDTSFAEVLLENDSGDSEKSEEVEEAVEITFGLERDLQSALRNNIATLEPNLKLIDGGKERVTEAGRLDITAEDSQGNIVVIELKAGVASPNVIAQVLAYMGAVAETDKKPVRGILVAGDFHKKVIWASRAIPNLELRKYSFQFSFEQVE